MDSLRALSCEHSLRAASICARTSMAARLRAPSSSSVRQRSPTTDSSSSWRWDMVSASAWRDAASRSNSAAAISASFRERAVSRSTLARYSSIWANWLRSLEASPSSRRTIWRPLSQAGLERLALLVLLHHPLAGEGDLTFQLRQRLPVGRDLAFQGLQPQIQLLRLAFRLADALLDGAAFLHLGLQASARALHLHIERSQLGACFREALLGFVADGLQAGVLLIPGGHLLGEGAEVAGCHVQVQGGLGGLAFEQAEAAGEGHPQPAIHFGFQLGVTPGLSRLAFERVHLAGDLLQDVVHARQVLLGTLQLGFR